MVVPACLLSVCGLLLLSTPCKAQEQAVESDPAAEALARLASQTRDEHCSGVAGRNITLAARAFTPVSEIWARVSYHYEMNGTVYLLYWRGVLEDCLNQEQQARHDLITFAAAAEDDPVWSDLVRDAQQRVRRIDTRLSAAGGRDPATVMGLGIGLGIGSAALAGAAGLAWDRSQEIAVRDIYPIDGLTGQQLAEAYKAAQTQAGVSYALVGAAIGCAVGSVISFVMTVPRGSKPRASRPSPPVLVPSRAGAIVHWQVQW